MTDPARTVVDMNARLADAAGRIHPTLRNLRELQPGYPATTPGNGSPGGGTGGHSASIVERLAGTIDDDDAYRDLARIRALIRDLEPRVRELHALCLRWGYRTAGEAHYGNPTPPRRSTEHDSNRERWCTSHERIHVAEPVGTHGREGLCRWCYEFKQSEGVLPPLELVDARSRGIKITDAVVRAALAVAPAETARPKRKRRNRPR